jgi:hypothetical protein
MPKSLVALAAGLLSMLVISMILQAGWLIAGLQMAPDQFVLPEQGQTLRVPDDIRWLLPTLGIDALAAAIGGLVVAVFSRGNRLNVVKISTGLVVAGCAVQVLSKSEYLPAWLHVARLFVAPSAMYFTARWWLRSFANANVGEPTGEETDDPEANGGDE